MYSIYLSMGILESQGTFMLLVASGFEIAVEAFWYFLTMHNRSCTALVLSKLRSLMCFSLFHNLIPVLVDHLHDLIGLSSLLEMGFGIPHPIFLLFYCHAIVVTGW